MKICSLWMTLGLLSLISSAASAQQITYREELITENRPVQQHVVVPVREYRMRSRLEGPWTPIHGPSWMTRPTAYYRWEERFQTAYQPVVRRAYRPVIETSLGPPRPVLLAERPRKVLPGPAPQAYDNPPLVAVQPPAQRTATVPSTTLKSRELKPGR